MKKFSYCPILSTVVLLVLMGLWGCEEYITSKIDTNLNDLNIVVSGKVTNEFTGEPVNDAMVQFDYMNTMTNDSGNYALLYTLGTDENRNKPVIFKVTASQYFPFEKEFIVYPMDNRINVSLTYAAPIVKDASIFLHKFPDYEPALIVIQTLVFDYQGARDIDSVNAVLTYRNTDNGSVKTVSQPMIYIQDGSFNSAYYQLTAFPVSQNVWELRFNFNLKVIDKSGYSIFYEHAYRPIPGDSPLFNPLFFPPVFNKTSRSG
ncbi:MAG: hypothetical protein JXL67_08140 [Calditrichaeota bacterium]|nr:hypothetical protein [Calditrichota bacterium]